MLMARSLAKPPPIVGILVHGAVEKKWVRSANLTTNWRFMVPEAANAAVTIAVADQVPFYGPSLGRSS